MANRPRSAPRDTVRLALRHPLANAFVNVAIFGPLTAVSAVVFFGHKTWFYGTALCFMFTILALNIIYLLREKLGDTAEVVVDDEGVTLARRTLASGTDRLPLSDLRHAYFIRRAAHPSGGPLLVVETKARTYELPCDWFDSEDDQRAFADALNVRLGRLPSSVQSATATQDPQDSTTTDPA
jgi:hypothetical protein